jgi:hypothetical protein
MLVSSLHKLPVELRLQIYAHMASVTEAPFWSYRGLYLSCKAIYIEMEEEGGKVLRRTLEEISSQWDTKSGLRLELRSKFSQMRRVTLHIHWSRLPVPWDWSRTRMSPEILRPLFQLYLDAVIIKTDWTNHPNMDLGFNCDGGNMSWRQLGAKTGMDTDLRPNACRLVYDLSDYLFDRPPDGLLGLVSGLTSDTTVNDWRVWTKDRHRKVIWVRTDTGLDETAHAWMDTTDFQDWWTNRCDFKEYTMDILTIMNKMKNYDVWDERGRIRREEAVARGFISGKVSDGVNVGNRAVS